MTPRGTESLVELAKDLRAIAPHIRDAYDLRKGAMLMQMAADVIERLAAHEPDIEVVVSEE